MYDVHMPTHMHTVCMTCKTYYNNLSVSLSNQYDTYTHSHIAHTVTPLLMCPDMVESL